MIQCERNILSVCRMNTTNFKVDILKTVQCEKNIISRRKAIKCRKKVRAN